MLYAQGVQHPLFLYAPEQGMANLLQAAAGAGFPLPLSPSPGPCAPFPFPCPLSRFPFSFAWPLMCSRNPLRWINSITWGSWRLALLLPHNDRQDLRGRGISDALRD